MTFSKQKLSNDPNNTRWTRDETSFGHKIMSSQGWTPGSLLGATNAPHAIHHTAANASHIRVILKDDTLGLGAKKGSGLAEGECTGLDVFKTLLGRLNGNEEEVVAELKSKEELKRAIYSERKWGTIRFVKGGVLVGDKIQDLIDGEKERLRALQGNVISESSGESANSEEQKIMAKQKSKSRKSKKRKVAEIMDDEIPEESTGSDKKKKKRESSDPARIARKAERAAKREAKTLKKAKKVEKERQTSIKSIPSANRPGIPHGIHAIRSRNIMQKRMASMDTVALNQVCLIFHGGVFSNRF